MVVERFSRPGIMVLGIVAALILGLKLLKPISLPAGTAAFSAAGVTGGMLPVTALPELPDVLAPTMSMQLRSRVQTDSADHPNTAAQVMRAWMAET